MEGIQFEIVNQSTNPVVVNGTTAIPGQVAMTNTRSSVSTGENALPYGEYTVREVSTNDSMLQTFTEEIPVTISEDGQVLTYEAENEVVRCGIDITKEDSQTGSTPQGNASFAGIDFEIINQSANSVVVDGTTYAVGDVVMTITTDENGHASTGNDALPYGTYEVRNPPPTNPCCLLGPVRLSLCGRMAIPWPLPPWTRWNGAASVWRNRTVSPVPPHRATPTLRVSPLKSSTIPATP